MAELWGFTKWAVVLPHAVHTPWWGRSSGSLEWSTLKAPGRGGCITQVASPVFCLLALVETLAIPPLGGGRSSLGDHLRPVVADRRDGGPSSLGWGRTGGGGYFRGTLGVHHCATMLYTRLSSKPTIFCALCALCALHRGAHRCWGFQMHNLVSWGPVCRASF